MFKLIDIIKGGGSNPKLNKFLNRYVISKKEKTNIIKEIKNSKGGSSTTYNRYYKFIKSADSTIGEALGILLPYTFPFLKVESDTQYNYIIGCIFSGQINLEDPTKIKAFQFTPVIAGYIYGEYRLAKDIEDFIYLYKLVNVTDLSPILDYIEEITADEFFNLNQL